MHFRLGTELRAADRGAAYVSMSLGLHPIEYQSSHSLLFDTDTIGIELASSCVIHVHESLRVAMGYCNVSPLMQDTTC
jgi:hypothetical protein